MMHVVETTEIRPRKTLLFVFAGLLILMIIIYLDKPSWRSVAFHLCLLSLSVFLLLIYFLSRKKIIIDNHGIQQELGFGKIKKMNWDEVSNSELEWHYHGHGANQTWNIQGNGKKIIIYPEHYSRNDLRVLAEALVNKAFRAAISEKVRKMAEGKFPWYRI